VCRLLKDVATTVAYDAAAWDNTQLQACVCDNGFFGADCSQRLCATGDDPITMCPDTVARGQVQQLKVTLGSKLTHTTASGGADTFTEGMELFGADAVTSFDAVRESTSSGQMLVGATDAFNQRFYAPTAAKAMFSASSAADVGAASLKAALEGIRNYRIDKVTVAAVTTGPASCSGDSSDAAVCPYGADSIFVAEKRYLVTFVPNALDSANFGTQKPLLCDSGYACTVAGCAPMVQMPFLYRYASSFVGTGGTAFSAVQGSTFSFFTGDANTDAAFTAVNFLRLHPLSAPQMPLGMSVDAGITGANTARYDVRVVVAVQDPDDGVDDSAVDVYWTKVIFGHTSISTDSYEYAAGTSTGVWSATKSSNFVPTLLGFTYRGFIPSDVTHGVSVPDAPGVILEFPSTNVVSTNGNFRFFEILVKLPACDVTPLASADDFKDAAGNALTVVDPRIENVECSNRGQCNRKSGLCECFSGFCAFAGAAGKSDGPQNASDPPPPLLFYRRPLLLVDDDDDVRV
jgi:hypothetical protein